MHTQMRLNRSLKFVRGGNVVVVVVVVVVVLFVCCFSCPFSQQFERTVTANVHIIDKET